MLAQKLQKILATLKYIKFHISLLLSAGVAAIAGVANGRKLRMALQAIVILMAIGVIIGYGPWPDSCRDQ